MAVGRLIVAHSHTGTTPHLLVHFGETLVAVEGPDLVKRHASPLGQAPDLVHELGKGFLPVGQKFARLAQGILPAQVQRLGNDLAVAGQGPEDL